MRRSPRALGRALTRFARPDRPRDLDAAFALAQRFAAGADGAASSDGAPANVRSILALKPHDQLGDFLVATPALRELRARFPAASITLVTRPYLAPLARRVAAIDRVLVTPRVSGPADVARALATLRAVRAPRPDLAIALNSVSRSRTVDALAAWSGARLVIGRSDVGAGPPRVGAPERVFDAVDRDPIYDLDVPIARASAHQVDRLLDLVAWAGAVTATATPATPRLDVSDDERATGRSALEALAPGQGPAIGVHPAAANPLKCWPVESFVTWGSALAARLPHARWIVIDTPKDPGPAHAVHAGLRARGVAAALLEARPLDELFGRLAALDLLACNDSGMMHVAAALGVATLSFHSLGAPGEWAPRATTSIALHADRIADIPVDVALDAADSLLARRAASVPRGEG